MKWNGKLLLLGVMLIAIGAGLWIARDARQAQITYSQFLQFVSGGKVAGVIIESGAEASPAICRLRDGHVLRTVLPANYRDAIFAMQDRGVDIEIRGGGRWPILNALPFLLLLAVWFYLMHRQSRCS